MFAITAGADTTSTVLANLFHSLITHPSDYARLRAEVDDTFPGEAPFDSAKLSKMPFLNAVMYDFRYILINYLLMAERRRNETLRLYPAVPGGSERRPLDGGKAFGDQCVCLRFVVRKVR